MFPQDHQGHSKVLKALFRVFKAMESPALSVLTQQCNEGEEQTLVDPTCRKKGLIKLKCFSSLLTGGPEPCLTPAESSSLYIRLFFRHLRIQKVKHHHPRLILAMETQKTCLYP
jgi:hypothetical protein